MEKILIIESDQSISKIIKSNIEKTFDLVDEVIRENSGNKIECSVSMIDIDNFKNVNDTYGHDVGDMVIKDLSRILKNNTKNSDVISRFGGEEFCILLKNINKEDNIKLLDKIRVEIEESTIHSIDGDINYTVST